VPAGVNVRPMPWPLAGLASTGGYWEENPAGVGPERSSIGSKCRPESGHSMMPSSPLVANPGSIHDYAAQWLEMADDGGDRKASGSKPAAHANN